MAVLKTDDTAMSFKTRLQTHYDATPAQMEYWRVLLSSQFSANVPIENDQNIRQELQV